MRLFIGLALSEEVRLTLGAVQSGLPGARWVTPQNIHLTLRFIGDIDPGRAEDIDTALRQILVPAFDLTLSGLGSFESKGRVRALWTEASKSEPLKRRKFKPHVTLARFKSGSSNERIGMFIQNNNDIQAGPFTVGRFTLFRSYLGHGGSIYESLAEYELYERITADV